MSKESETLLRELRSKTPPDSLALAKMANESPDPEVQAILVEVESMIVKMCLWKNPALDPLIKEMIAETVIFKERD